MTSQSGLSGLAAASRNLDVIGNNIANANTVGMKSSRAEFSELVASALGAGGGISGGIGVEVAAVSQQFSQGNINITGNDLDLAINGGGFLQLQQADDSAAYTRKGAFKLDKEGSIVTNSGAHLMGYPTDIDGNPTSAIIQSLQLPTNAPIGAQPTSSIAAEFNLDARAKLAVNATPPTPLTTHGTSLTAYDSQGVGIPVSLYFSKVGPDPLAIPPVTVDTWDVFDASTVAAGSTALTANSLVRSTNLSNAALDVSNTALNVANNATDVTNAALNLANVATVGWGDLPTYALGTLTLYPTYAGAGLNPAAAVIPPSSALGASGSLFQMTFDVNGQLLTPVLPPSLSLTSPNPAIGSFSATLDVSKATNFGASFSVSNLTQDGYTSGELVGLNIGVDGKISARYSNGETQITGQVALAEFRNAQGLEPTGGGNWIETFASGQPVQGSPGQGKFGALRAGALEESNVDLTAELVNMMTAQRAYQANAQTIKTQDQVLSTLVNLR